MVLPIDLLEKLREGPAGFARWEADESTKPAPESSWTVGELAGRLTEISGQGARSSLTAAAVLLLDAQKSGEPSVWVSRAESSFFPPDMARAGVDLEALAVVFTPSAQAAANAAARLVRSGAFGLVVVDLGRSPQVPMALQGRLASLAVKHDTAVVLITEKPVNAPSVGSMISLRVEAHRVAVAPFTYRIRLVVVKDKRRGPGWSHDEVADGPDGLR